MHLYAARQACITTIEQDTTHHGKAGHLLYPYQNFFPDNINNNYNNDVIKTVNVYSL